MLHKLGLVSATAVLVSVLGCSSTRDFTAAHLPACQPKGNDRDCSVKVIVEATSTACTVRVEPSLDEIEFPRGQRDKFIFWQISGPSGYSFTEDGIAIEKNVPRDFDQPKVMDHGRTFRWKNLHRQPEPKVYYYAVTVTNADGSITCWQDPKINNR